MELRDLIVTPLLITLVYLVAYMIRPRVTDSVTRVYFFPALTLKILGALAVGFIYQFYYDGGDTFNFHTHGSRVIWNAFVESPVTGLKLLFANGELSGETFKYSSQIPFYRDASSYFVIRIASILDLITFSSYSATAILFSVIGFTGMWMLFSTFYRLYPRCHAWIAVACFFVPSVFFWGSGLLKDTLTLTGICLIVYAIGNLFIGNRFSIWAILILVSGVWVVYVVKMYILVCLLPAIILWIYAARLFRLRSLMVKILLVPVILVSIFLSGYGAIVEIGKGDSRYSIDQLAKTAQVTAYDIRYYTGREAGSGYSLGELDGSFESMIRLAPAAINVSLFRPYIWEVQNPLMLLSSIESIAVFSLIGFAILKRRWTFFRAWLHPDVLFCMVFSLVFAFAVGVSTYNFGTLARYKIPLLPFFVVGIAIILNYDSNRTQSKLPSGSNSEP